MNPNESLDEFAPVDVTQDHESNRPPDALDSTVDKSSAASRKAVAGSPLRALAAESSLRVVSGGLGIVSIGLMTRSIRPSELGFYSVWTTAVGVVAALAELAQRQPMLRDLSQALDADHLGRYIFTRLIYVSVAAAVMSAILLWLTGSGEVLPGLLIISTLYVTPVSCTTVVLHANYRGDIVGWSVFFQSILWAVTLGAVYATKSGLTGVCAALLVSNMLAAGYGATRAARFLPIRVRPGRWRAKGHSSKDEAFLVGASSSVLIAWKVDLPVVYAVLNSGAAGLYASAYRILDTMALLPSTLANVLMRGLSTEELGGSHRSARLVAAGTFVCCSGPIVFAPISHVIDRLLFGPGYANAAPLMVIFLGALPLVMLRYMWATVFIARGKARNYSVVSAVYAVVSISSVVTLALIWGIRGAAVATPIAELSFTVAACVAPVGRAAIRLWWGAVLTCILTSVAVCLYGLLI